MSNSFYTKLAGVSKKNEDGRRRQEVIEDDLYEGLELHLEREPDNAFDSDAIAVFASKYGDQVGYLIKAVAEELAPLMDRGQLVTCKVTEITGDYGQTRGVNVQITKYTLEETRELIEAANANKPVKEAPKPDTAEPKLTPPEWTESAVSASAPGKAIPRSTPSVKPNLRQRWGSLPKKTRTWIIIIAIIILLYLCGMLQPAL